MRILKLGTIACTAFALVACAPEDRPDVAVDEPALEEPTIRSEPTVQPPAAALQATLEAIGGSGVSGEVHATPRENETHILLTVRGARPDESYGARVHSGTCQSPGPELARLDAVSTDDAGQGQSETNVGHAPNLILDGNHIVAVYAPGTEPERDRPAACTTLPAASGTRM